MLIGRETECARIDELLDRARLGRSSALVVRGEAGIGKTALLEYAAERAQEMTVVRARGIESEAELEFSALLDVCRPLLGSLAELPEHQAAALRAALDLGPAVTVDRFAIGAATLGVLAAAAEDAPLLVLVDDAHWLDPSSADALLFATRRLQADRVLTLYAVREGEGRPLETSGIESMAIVGLSREHTTSLLGLEADLSALSADVADRLHQATGGNPLALLELPGLLTPDQLAGIAPIDQPLPAGSSVEHAFTRRAEALPADARRALLVAAASVSDDVSPVIQALDGLGLGAASLEPAEDAGLVVIVGERLEFRHPLVRSAVYQSATPSARRTAHRVLADAYGDSHPARRAWHLAAAALGPDEDVAGALDSVGTRARERNALAEAAVAFERAARLTPDPARRVVRFTDAAEAAWLVADADRAIGLFESALAGSPGPAERGRLLHLRGVIERRVGLHSASQDVLLEAEALLADERPTDAAHVLVEAVQVAFWAGNLGTALELARRLRDGAPRDGGWLDSLADNSLGWILYLTGRADEGAPILEHAVGAMLAPAEPSRFQLYSAGVALSLLERAGEGDALTRRAARMARTEGVPRAVLTALAALTAADVRAGRWRPAVANAEEGLELAHQLGHTDQHTSMTIELAKIDAARGEEARCRERIAACVRLADERGIVTLGVTARAVLGTLELSLGNLAEASERLDAVAADVERLGLHDRDVSPHHDLCEALVRDGRRDEAAEVLVRLADRARRGMPLWGAALVARGRGMLADDEAEANARFEEALELHARVEDGFQRARTLLAFGERLRRAGQRRQGRERLRAALGLFEELDARPWAERARQELRASGEKLRRRESVDSEQLTSQELQIALQVAEGKTNKEVGTALFLSHKTVEFHLSRIYRKLDISSRAELIRRFADAGDAVLEPVR